MSNVNKVLIYFFLVFIYLGLSKGLSPTEFGIQYVKNNEELSRLIEGAPVSVILTDVYSTGFIIKTYYHKYKIVYGKQPQEELVVRALSSFKSRNMDFLGLSVFRRYDDDRGEEFTPLPPGSVFIGDNNYGQWASNNAGIKEWRFFRGSRHLPQYLGWKTFTPTLNTLATVNRHKELGQPYFGDDNEFGLKGSITKQAFPKYFERQKPKKNHLKKFLSIYINDFFTKKSNTKVIKKNE